MKTRTLAGLLPVLLVVLLQLLLASPSVAELRHKKGAPKEDAYNEYEKGDTVIIDDFGSKELTAKLSDPIVWVNCEEKGKMWMDWGTKPKNIWQALNVLIWKDHPEVKQAKANNQAFVGFQYWCNHTSNQSPQEGNHWQVVIDDANKTHPHMGAIYFGHPHVIQGGLMNILPKQDRFKIDMDEPFKAKHYSLQFANIQAKVQHVDPDFNRLVTFNSSMWHGVHRIITGNRFQFATNIWTQKPKPGPTPEEIKQRTKLRRQKKLTKAYKNYQPGDTTIIDDFGEDGLTGKLTDEKIWEKCAKKKDKRWMDWGAEPRNVWEVTAKFLWQMHPEIAAAKNRSESFAGMEYWCMEMRYDRHEEAEGIPFGIQTDEARVSYPVLGAHYYGFQHRHSRYEDITGGELRILHPHDATLVTTSEEATAYAEKYAKRDPSTITEVEPKYNRLVVFNATNWHGINAVEHGEYAVLMVNLWKEKPKTWKDLKISSYSYADSDDDTPQHDEF